LPLRVLGELLGLPREDLAQLHVWGNDWILVQQEGPLEKRLAHARGTVALQHYFLDAVRRREREPTDDLIGALVAARNHIDPPLTDLEIAGLPLDLMVAGHVTVTRAIGSALNLLFSCPHLRDHLLDPEQAPRSISASGLRWRGSSLASRCRRCSRGCRGCAQAADRACASRPSSRAALPSCMWPGVGRSRCRS